MVGPVEALCRVTATAEEIWLPGAIGGDAGNLVQLRLIRHRVGGIGCRGGHQQVDLVIGDQFGRDFRCAVGIGLRILGDNLDGNFFAVVLDAIGEGLLDAVENIAAGFTEAGDGTGLRADEADLEGGVLGRGAGDTQDRGCGHQSAGGFEQAAAGDVGDDWHSVLPKSQAVR